MILAVIMQALDTTIANVALPYMQGSVSASADQINWVLTSYIVAAAIMTPPSGFLANRFGRKRVLLTAIAGFVVASMLCGMAQSLVEIVAFRLLQGFFGAALVPLAQSILLDIYTPEERGSAMALFGVSVMVGPVLGPVIGGWLTDHFSWRWVFYINVPIGALAFAGILLFVQRDQDQRDGEARLARLRHPERRHRRAADVPRSRRAARLVLLARDPDRGGHLRHRRFISFSCTPSRRRTPSSIRGCSSTATSAVGMLFIFIIGITYLASMALMTPYLQTLMGYPVVTAGLVMGPRGLGTMMCMFVVGRPDRPGRHPRCCSCSACC